MEKRSSAQYNCQGAGQRGGHALHPPAARLPSSGTHVRSGVSWRGAPLDALTERLRVALHTPPRSSTPIRLPHEVNRVDRRSKGGPRPPAVKRVTPCLARGRALCCCATINRYCSVALALLADFVNSFL